MRSRLPVPRKLPASPSLSLARIDANWCLCEMAWRSLCRSSIACDCVIFPLRTQRVAHPVRGFSFQIKPLKQRLARAERSVKVMAAAEIASHPISTVSDGGSKKVIVMYRHAIDCSSRSQMAQGRILHSLTHLYAQEYETLCEKLKEMSTLGGISGLLGWGEHPVTCSVTLCTLCSL